MWPRASPLASLGSSLLICKMRVLTSVIEGPFQQKLLWAPRPDLRACETVSWVHYPELPVSTVSCPSKQGLRSRLFAHISAIQCPSLSFASPGSSIQHRACHRPHRGSPQPSRAGTVSTCESRGSPASSSLFALVRSC